MWFTRRIFARLGTGVAFVELVDQMPLIYLASCMRKLCTHRGPVAKSKQAYICEIDCEIAQMSAVIVMNVQFFQNFESNASGLISRSMAYFVSLLEIWVCGAAKLKVDMTLFRSLLAKLQHGAAN